MGINATNLLGNAFVNSRLYRVFLLAWVLIPFVYTPSDILFMDKVKLYNKFLKEGMNKKEAARLTREISQKVENLKIEYIQALSLRPFTDPTNEFAYEDKMDELVDAVMEKADTLKEFVPNIEKILDEEAKRKLFD